MQYGESMVSHYPTEGFRDIEHRRDISDGFGGPAPKKVKKSELPFTSKLLIRNLPSTITKDELRPYFSRIAPRTLICLGKREEKGFKSVVAFIDMATEEAAEEWMTANKSVFTHENESYEMERIRSYGDAPKWECAKCSTSVDSRFILCQTCCLLRDDSEDIIANAFHLIGTAPTDTLLFRNFPKHLTAKTLGQAISRIGELVQILHIHMAKNKNYALVQLESDEDASMVCMCFDERPLKIEGKNVSIYFSKISLTEFKAAQDALVKKKQKQVIPVSSVVLAPAFIPLAASASEVPVPATTMAAPVISAESVAVYPAKEIVNEVLNPPIVSRGDAECAAGDIVEQARFRAAQNKAAQAVAVAQLQLQQPPPIVAPTASSISFMQAAPVASAITTLPPPGFFVQNRTGEIIDLTRPPPMILSAAPVGMPIAAPITSMPAGSTVIVNAAGVPIQTIPGTVVMSASGPTSIAVPQAPSIQIHPPAQAIPQQPAAPPGGVIGNIDTPYGKFPQYVTPNPALFADEPSSGYKIDMTTMFYYDTKTSFYYVNALQEWCTWDPMYATYIPVKRKSEVAQQVQAKALAAVTSAPNTQSAEKKPNAAALALVDVKRQYEQRKQKVSLSFTKAPNTTSVAPPNVLTQNPLLVADPDSSDEDRKSKEKSPEKKVDVEEAKISAQKEREAMERNLVNRNSKTCLLCKRVFPSLDILDKHVNQSEMHRKNLELRRVEWSRELVTRMMNTFT